MRISKLLVVFFIFCGISFDFIHSTQCGLKNEESKEWPWITRILKANGDLLCTGTLISNSKVLTTASCFYKEVSGEFLEPSDVKVQFGKHYLSRRENDYSVVPDQMTIHFKWKPNHKPETFNLALLVFDKEVKMSAVISPACLGNNATNIMAQGTVVGWSFPPPLPDKPSFSDDTPMKVQAEREMNTISRASTLMYTFIVPFSSGLGSGFFIQAEGIWFLDGVVSSSKYNQSIFTRIKNFKTWISIDKRTEKLQCELRTEYIHGLTCQAQNLTVSYSGIVLAPKGDNNNWKSVEAIRIDGQNIKVFPLNVGKLFPQLKVIKAKNSKLTLIEKLSFMNMQNVEILDLPSNLLEKIAFNTFWHLTNLKELDLSRNRLKDINKKTFSYNPNLEDIDASHNEIKILRNDLFKHNEKLKSINFNHNKISQVAFRFDARFTSVDIFLVNNDCFNQMFLIDGEQNFNVVNKLLAQNCTDTADDPDYLSLFLD